MVGRQAPTTRHKRLRVDRPTDQQIDAWYRRLSRTALRLTGNVEDAADLTQQAFCKALRQWDQFDGRALPMTWLHNILLNCVRDWIRRRSVRAGESIDAWDLIPMPDAHGGSLGDVERQEQLSHLREAVLNLPETVQPAFVSTVLDGYSYKEASELLGVPVGTIASRVYEARRQVTAAMRERFGEE